MIIALGCALLSNCAVVLKAPDCRDGTNKHTWSAWRTTRAADEFSHAVQERKCRICEWTQTHGQ